MLYFAYGSNLDWKQIKDRCPATSFFCIAKLHKYRLDFTRYSDSVNRKCGVADIVSDLQSEVWGVVYRIDELDLGRLDKAEGYYPSRKENAYRRFEAIVFQDGNEDKPLTVSTYEVVKKELDKHRPSKEYRDQIIEGSKYWRLPNDYIEKLERIEVQNGPKAVV